MNNKCKCCSRFSSYSKFEPTSHKFNIDNTNNYGRFTIYWNNHGQHCPYCSIYLRTVSDNFGGGSHYWKLQCVSCHKVFSFGTYDFKLYEN